MLLQLLGDYCNCCCCCCCHFHMFLKSKISFFPHFSIPAHNVNAYSDSIPTKINAEIDMCTNSLYYKLVNIFQLLFFVPKSFSMAQNLTIQMLCCCYFFVFILCILSIFSPFSGPIAPVGLLGFVLQIVESFCFCYLSNHVL